MAPQSKKRKGPSQSTTLHHFFSSDAIATKKSKNQSPARDARRHQRAASSPQDQVIVIVDSDEDVPPSKGKESIRGGSSTSAVGSMDNPSKRPKKNNVAAIYSSSLNNMEIDTTVANKQGRHTSAFEDEDTLSFGEPSILLRARNPVRPIQPDIIAVVPSSGLPSDLLRPSKASSSTSPSFGSPVSLLRDIHGIEPQKLHEDISLAQPFPITTIETVEQTTRGSVPSLHPGSVQACAASSDFTDSSAYPKLDDEWVMGDDEMAHVDPEHDDPVGEETENVGSSFPEILRPPEEEHGVTTCPMCAFLLLGLSATEVEEHVNKCIDSPPISPSALSTVQAVSATNVVTDSLKAPYESSGGGNAFSVLMSSHKDNDAWKEAAVVEDRSFKPSGGRRKAPFYKVLQGMPIAVDAFRYGNIPGVTAYFLTHAHSDHYTNLTSNWKSGPIYCSQGTANLIIHMLAVDPKWVHPLPMDTPSVIPNTGGVHVTLIEANHCPGSCLFLFEGPQTVNAGDSIFKSPFVGSPRTFRYLHCGDFRASPRHVMHPAVKGKQIDHVYLDTTYLDPKYTFPPQPLVISACAELAKKIVNEQYAADSSIANKDEARTINNFMARTEKAKGKEEKILVVVGTYSIGKERIVKAIAQALNTKIYCDARKASILHCQSDQELNALLTTTDPQSAGVHLVPLSIITSDKLKIYMDRFKGKYARVVGFRPTGWTFTAQAGFEQSPSIPSILSRSVSRPLFTHSSLYPSRNSTSTVTLYGVPYSEHSSFFELTCFAMSLEWGKMIATVNVGSAKSRGNIARWIDKWEAERKRRGKWEIIKYRELDYW